MFSTFADPKTDFIFKRIFGTEASNAYVMQLPTGEAYRDLCPVVGVTICDFVFWPGG